ncbi:hypothetical protein L1887_58989 [Cichorium endivia]|nr:hypothetical protein L1887_58989 [Cichorium endivia]
MASCATAADDPSPKKAIRLAWFKIRKAARFQATAKAIDRGFANTRFLCQSGDARMNRLSGGGENDLGHFSLGFAKCIVIKLQRYLAEVPGDPTEENDMAVTQTAQACDLVIFGAKGDLARRKLLPSLYQLEKAGQIHPDTRLGEAKLNAKPARVVMEKPLGTSLATSREINDQVGEFFEEVLAGTSAEQADHSSAAGRRGGYPDPEQSAGAGS